VRETTLVTVLPVFTKQLARVAELADALDLGSSRATCAGSSPASRTCSSLEYSGVLWSPSLRALTHFMAVKSKRGVCAPEYPQVTPKRLDADQTTDQTAPQFGDDTEVPRNPRRKVFTARRAKTGGGKARPCVAPVAELTIHVTCENAVFGVILHCPETTKQEQSRSSGQD
jgi:hypothetical protein